MIKQAYKGTSYDLVRVRLLSENRGTLYITVEP
jgi:hypothetical protein